MENKKTKENIHKGHRQRMKNKYLKSGIDIFEDHEILELLLYYCIPRRDTNAIAHNILNSYGKLSNLFDASPLEIQKRCEVSEQTAILLSLIAPLSKRYNLDKWSDSIIFKNSKMAVEYIRSLFIGESVECFYVIFLDSNLKLIKSKFISRGTLDRVEIYPREFIRSVLLYNAVNIILAHNHPNASTEISYFDEITTSVLKKTLDGIESNLIDHIVICGNKYISMAEKKGALRMKGIERYHKEMEDILVAEGKSKPKFW